MLTHDIQAELRRLQLHPANLDASATGDGQISLNGSLLAHWPVPRIVDGGWFLKVLNELPDVAGPEATMNAFCAAHTRSHL